MQKSDKMRIFWLATTEIVMTLPIIQRWVMNWKLIENHRRWWTFNSFLRGKKNTQFIFIFFVISKDSRANTRHHAFISMFTYKIYTIFGCRARAFRRLINRSDDDTQVVVRNRLSRCYRQPCSVIRFMLSWQVSTSHFSSSIHFLIFVIRNDWIFYFIRKFERFWKFQKFQIYVYTCKQIFESCFRMSQITKFKSAFTV